MYQKTSVTLLADFLDPSSFAPFKTPFCHFLGLPPVPYLLFLLLFFSFLLLLLLLVYSFVVVFVLFLFILLFLIAFFVVVVLFFCKILRFNVHTRVEYLNKNVSIGQLLQHIQSSIVVCAGSRPKRQTKTYNKEVCQVS